MMPFVRRVLTLCPQNQDRESPTTSRRHLREYPKHNNTALSTTPSSAAQACRSIATPRKGGASCNVRCRPLLTHATIRVSHRAQTLAHNNKTPSASVPRPLPPRTTPRMALAVAMLSAAARPTASHPRSPLPPATTSLPRRFPLSEEATKVQASILHRHRPQGLTSPLAAQTHSRRPTLGPRPTEAPLRRRLGDRLCLATMVRRRAIPLAA
jgi:hypothetical protein